MGAFSQFRANYWFWDGGCGVSLSDHWCLEIWMRSVSWDRGWVKNGYSACEWQQWGQLDPQVPFWPAMTWEEPGVSNWRKGGWGTQGWRGFWGCPQSPVNFARFLQWAGMFSLSEKMFSFLSASTWVILKNKMLSEKSRLQKGKYNMPPFSYMFRMHDMLEYIFYACIYIYSG